MVTPIIKKIASRYMPQPLLRFLKVGHYVKILRSQSFDSEPDLKVVSCLVGPGDTTVDIGANIGVYSSFLSNAVGKDGRVYSIEPVPQTFELLTRVASKLNLANLEFINCALSDSEGGIVMEIPTYNSGLENFYQARIVRDSSDDLNFDHVEVKSNTIDNLFAALASDISFIKVDVEGHELTCLQGAKQFLERTDCAWLIEISGDPDDESSTARQVFDKLLKNGYEAWWFDGTKLHRRKQGERSINYFFLKQQRAEMLKAKQPELVA